MRFTHRFVIHRVKLCGRGYLGVDRLKVWSLGRRETLERGKFRLGRLVIHLKKGGCVCIALIQLRFYQSKQAVALKTDIKHRGYFMWTKPLSITRINRQPPPFQIFYVRLRDTLASRGATGMTLRTKTSVTHLFVRDHQAQTGNNCL